MTDEFEKALHRALRTQDPGEDFSARVVARLDSAHLDSTHLDLARLDSARLDSTRPGSSEMPTARVARLEYIRRRAFRSRWLPATLAAVINAGIGLVQLRQHALDAARANQARAQLLEALSIASDNVNIVRAAVTREENPDS